MKTIVLCLKQILLGFIIIAFFVTIYLEHCGSIFYSNLSHNKDLPYRQRLLSSYEVDPIFVDESAIQNLYNGIYNVTYTTDTNGYTKTSAKAQPLSDDYTISNPLHIIIEARIKLLPENNHSISRTLKHVYFIK